jgi:F-type H+-transporting ATPase subunit delta
MSVTNVANRYARALADVITERAEVDEVTSDLRRFAGLQNGHSDLLAVFASPVVNVDRKRAVLNELLSRLSLTNSRLHQLDQMLEALGREIDRRSNFVTAEVTTAREIDDQQKDELRHRLKTATGKEVRLTFHTDSSIIGGVVTRIDSLVYDGSVRNQLAQMKQRFLSAH